VGRKIKRVKRQPPRFFRQLNYDGCEPTTRETHGLNITTFRDIIILRSRQIKEFEHYINRLRHEAHVPDLILADLEALTAEMRRSPSLNGKHFDELKTEFMTRFIEIVQEATNEGTAQ
jgi:hypothetical protein